MHISEGVLSLPVLSAGAVLSVVGVAIGLKKLKQEKMVQAAVLSSSFFVASLIHIPVSFSSVHLILNGIVGLLMGWAAFPIILIALFLQSIFFQFGGLTVIGVNTFVLAFPAVLAFYIFSPLIKNDKQRLVFFFAFLCGFFTIFCSALLLVLTLFLTDQNFLKLALVVLASHFPVMVIEGFITAFCVLFLKKVGYL